MSTKYTIASALFLFLLVAGGYELFTHAGEDLFSSLPEFVPYNP